MTSTITPWGWKKKRLPIGKDEQAVTSLQRQMNRLFNDFFTGTNLLPEFFSEPLAQLGEKFGNFAPNVNVVKRENAIIVTVEVPGMDEKDIELSLTKDSLTIRGERKQDHESKGEGGWHYVESSYGAFERVIPLGEFEIDEDRVEASASKGIVTISLPLKASSRSVAKKVSIKAA